MTSQKRTVVLHVARPSSFLELCNSGFQFCPAAGVVHVDHVANERLYGKPVEPAAILDGKVPPPASFKQLIDVLNAVEDGKIDRRQSDADSDVSSQGVHTALEHDLVSLFYSVF